MNGHDTKILFIGLLSGVVLAVVLTAGLVIATSGLGWTQSEVGPCRWEFHVKDATGQPVQGAALNIVDASRKGVLSERLWHPMGNWQGEGSLITNEQGIVVLELDRPVAFGGELWGDLCGVFERRSAPEPWLEVQCCYTIYSMPVLTATGTIELTCYRHSGDEAE